MIIIGHPWVPSPSFCKIFSQDEIKNTQSNQILLLEALNKSQAIAQYCQVNSIAYAVTVNTLTEALFASINLPPIPLPIPTRKNRRQGIIYT